MLSTWSPRSTRCGALLLVAVATLGVAMPRARVTARERVGRAVAIRSGSPRINDRLGWVAPDPGLVEGVSESQPGLRPAGAAGGADVAVAAWRRQEPTAPVSPALALLAARPASYTVSPGHRHRTFGRPPPRA